MSDPQKEMEALRKRWQELDRKRSAAEANLAGANQRLDDLKRQARDQFGTDDPEALKTRLAEMKSENERRTAEYAAHLAEVERALAEVEQQYKGVGA